MEGRIDRVDLTVDGSALRIVDYKTGRPTSAVAERRSSLQLPLYAASALAATARVAARAEYWFIGPQGRVEVRPKKDELGEVDQERMHAAYALAQDAIAGVRRGDVQPRPSDPRNCLRCDARDICRRPPIAAAEEDLGRGTP